MNSRELIDSGTLELYVFGKLSEKENETIAEMAKQYPEVQDEILAIENAVINLSQSVAPHLSATNYEKIRTRLLDKHKVVPISQKKSWISYTGWAAAAIFVLGFGFQFYKLNQTKSTIDQLSVEKSKMQESIVDLELKKQEAQNILTVLRDQNNIQITLNGQEVAPYAFAKAYYNKETKDVFIDAAGLPDPPKGKVYQVWGLKLDPLTPKSIGLLKGFAISNSKIFKVEKVDDAEAFGITLEPEGGSISPTLEQLYTLGKV
ncbi:anti-sigma factor [Flavobacterium sp. NRK F10]|uniref:Anti-sigma factor n=1 Tax=Flavobacterium sediminis TaxID=2201181 RepID=A0A2U8QR53_9FLAO|nr:MULTISPECIES: anti-sigma factor [Flavobacterium]AWM12597.1 anti-sigma factor [Flavobacterium sediminis]MCO6173705.1 anti-sigma factor [Flavobacterium sp. NRK F10]